MSVHVVGNLCFDNTLTLPRFPEPGETMVALDSRTGLGGKGINQAVAAARAGADVVCYVAVGLLELDAVRQTLLGEDGLELALSGVPMPSDTSTILVRPDGENMIISATACARALDTLAETTLAEIARAGDVVLMQGNLAAAATAACLAGARRRGAATMLNPSPLWPGGIPDLATIDWLVINAGELQQLTGDADPDRGAAQLFGRGAAGVVVTLGSRGAILVSADERMAVEAPPVEVVDTTGAGDVFCGVMAAMLSRHAEPGEALARATAAASLSVTRAGALAGCPLSTEITALQRLQVTRSSR